MWHLQITDNWHDIWGTGYQCKWTKLLLESENSHVFFHPKLVKAWTETYIQIRSIQPIFIWGTTENNKVFFPLILWKKNIKNAFLNVIVPVGYSDFDYHDPIFEHEPTKLEVDSFWETLDILLNTYNYDEIIFDGIHDKYSPANYTKKNKDVCPYLNLSNLHTDTELLYFLSSSLRGDIRRQIRRLNELGRLNIHEYVTNEDAFSTIDKFLFEHSKKWPYSYKAPSFHRNLISNGLGSIVHFSSLNIDNTPIAWHLGFEYKKTYYYYMPIGSEAYSHYSPVKIHLYYLITRAINLNYKNYDHLRGDETYKQGWSNGIGEIYQYGRCNTKIISKVKTHIITLKKILLHH